MADETAPQGAWQQWFLSVWEAREERVYRELFTDLGSGIHAAKSEHYQRLGQSPRHPGWLHHGVFACPPHGDRAHWTYVTSGLSNPWNLAEPGRDPAGVSGTGFELCLCTEESADWAITVLHHLMAWQLLVAVGAVQGQPLGPGQRVPLGGPIDGATTSMTWALCEPPEHMSKEFELPSGKVEWLLLVGARQDEVDFARQSDQKVLVERLQQRGIWPLSNPSRDSVVK